MTVLEEELALLEIAHVSYLYCVLSLHLDRTIPFQALDNKSRKSKSFTEKESSKKLEDDAQTALMTTSDKGEPN